MQEPVYKIIEVVGAAAMGIEEAIQHAIEKASQTLKHLDWFEVVQIRGCLDKGKVKHYQVVLKVGFRLDA